MIHNLEILIDRVKIYRSRTDFIEVLYDEVSNADEMKALLQGRLDIRTPVSAYPFDDPVVQYFNTGDRIMMGLMKKEFIDGTDIVFRDAEITEVIYSDGKYYPSIKDYAFIGA